jgi:hypothetical protein
MGSCLRLCCCNLPNVCRVLWAGPELLTHPFHSTHSCWLLVFIPFRNAKGQLRLCSTLLDTTAKYGSQARKVETAQARTTPVESSDQRCKLSGNRDTVMIKHTRNRHGTQARIILLPSFINILHPISNSPSLPYNFPLCMLVHEKKGK